MMVDSSDELEAGRAGNRTIFCFADVSLIENVGAVGRKAVDDETSLFGSILEFWLGVSKILKSFFKYHSKELDI